MTITLEGKINERAKDAQQPYHEIFINTRRIDPAASLRVRRHASEFNWGFGGGGVAQAALAICIELFIDFTDHTEYNSIYHKFKWDYLANRVVEKNFLVDVDLNKFMAPYKGLKVKSVWKP